MSAQFDPSILNETRGSEIIATVTVLTVFVVLSTGARLISKWVFKLKFGWDDYMIILGTILNLIGNAFEYLAVASGLGRHAQYLTPEQEINVMKWAQLSVAIPFFAVWSVKISICFFLFGIIRGTHKYFRWSIHALIWLTTITTFIGVLLWGLQAKPIAKLWDPNIPGTRSSSQAFVVSVYIELALACFTDIFYALAPIYFLWRIQMSWRRKFPILALTGCGILVMAVGILDIVFVRTLLDEDLTFAIVDLFICDMIERNFSAFVANLPALWTLGRELRKVNATRVSSGNTYNKGPSNNIQTYEDQHTINEPKNGTVQSSNIVGRTFPSRRTTGPMELAVSGTAGFKANKIAHLRDANVTSEYDDHVPLHTTSHHSRRIPRNAPRDIHVRTEIHVEPDSLQDDER